MYVCMQLVSNYYQILKRATEGIAGADGANRTHPDHSLPHEEIKDTTMIRTPTTSSNDVAINEAIFMQ